MKLKILLWANKFMPNSDDKKSDDDKIKPKISLTSNTAKRAVGFGSQAEFFEQRNALRPNKEAEQNQVATELKNYLDFKDTSVAIDIQTNQREILKEISEYLEKNPDGRGIFEAVKTLFSKKDIVWTDQLNKIGVRLVRLYELQREGTTDVYEFPATKDVLKEYSFNLLRFRKEQDEDAAIFTLKNLENSTAGSTEVSLENLQKTRSIVQSALQDKLVKDYQSPLNPQRLEGPQGDMQRIKTDVSPEIIVYLRLFESLTIAIIKQQEITREKQAGVEIKKIEVLHSLDRLSKISGIGISTELRDRFMNKMAVMNLDQLKFFDFKILELFNNLSNQSEENRPTSEQANSQISGWLEKKFDRQELHADLEDRKKKNRQTEEQAKQDLRQGKVVNIGIKSGFNAPITESNRKYAV